MSGPLRLAFVMPSVPCTRELITGTTAVGGSESSVMGVARALAARGHAVTIYAINPDVGTESGIDAKGVQWKPMQALAADGRSEEWDVFVAVRDYSLFLGSRVHARLRLLWAHDLLVPQAVPSVMAASTQLDGVLYVSEYHRQQWEGLAPLLQPLGVVTTNGIDLSLVPMGVEIDPHRAIYVSRPERGLGPLLQMWPALKAEIPDATLAICRYSVPLDQSDYAPALASWDRAIAAAHEAVGGIEVLGGLTKPDLYRALSRAAVLWYPGVSDFAETSCIAAIEAQACGTPVVASYRGALPETAHPSYADGLLIDGDATTARYQRRSVRAVAKLMRACADGSRAYTGLASAGRIHASGYGVALVAAWWEAWLAGQFQQRSTARPIRLVRALLHEDDHVAAQQAIEAFGLQAPGPDQAEAVRALERCAEVISGRECTPAHYGQFAMADPLEEGRESGRLKAAVERFAAAGVTRVLDVACGNGAFALALAQALPEAVVIGVDASEQNIARAIAAAAKSGLSDRVRFQVLSVVDMATQEVSSAWRTFATEIAPFDGLFCGEFVEHVANTVPLIDALESVCVVGAFVLVTVPHGPWGQLAPRNVERHQGHVHRFASEDVRRVFDQKDQVAIAFSDAGVTPRGLPIGHWFIRYRHAEGRQTRRRDLTSRIQRTRPYERLSVGLIAHNAAADLAGCLESVWWIADQIVVGDTGSTDETAEIARRYGATVLTLPQVQDFDDGFAGARNAVLDACDGDWFLWIDADERLLGGHELRKHMESGPYTGIILRQHHLSIESPTQYDTPVRLFRRRPEIRFFGCIHEMPGFGDENTDIKPTLELPEVRIAHTGYLTKSVVQAKTFGRNMPLMAKDRARFPSRKLGALLRLRDECAIADLLSEQHGGYVTAEAEAGYRRAIALFDAHCSDPANGLHQYARPWYEHALTTLREGWEIWMALSGQETKHGTLGSVQPQRFVVRTKEEARRLSDHFFKDVDKAMDPPPINTMPAVGRKRRALAGAA